MDDFVWEEIFNYHFRDTAVMRSGKNNCNMINEGTGRLRNLLSIVCDDFKFSDIRY